MLTAMVYIVGLLVLAVLLVGSAVAVLIAIARLEEILPPTPLAAGEPRHRAGVSTVGADPADRRSEMPAYARRRGPLRPQ